MLLAEAPSQEPVTFQEVGITLLGMAMKYSRKNLSLVERLHMIEKSKTDLLDPEQKEEGKELGRGPERRVLPLKHSFLMTVGADGKGSLVSFF